MKKLLLIAVAITLLWGYSLAEELEYFQTYKLKEGMSADEIMRIKYFNKYTLFAHDLQYTGRLYLIDKSGQTRERSTLRKRIIIGSKSTGISYKDLAVVTAPAQVKGLANLSWTYLDPNREPNIWLWLPSLRKTKKISIANADDSFTGTDFTIEDIISRKFEDETYKLVKEEIFSGYTSEFMKKTYYKDTPCYVIEAIPKKVNWYYTKRLVWVDKNYGSNIYEEKYDAKGRKFQVLFRWYEIFNVNSKEYPIPMFAEGRNLRSGHCSEIVNGNCKLDQGLSEEEFSEGVLSHSHW